MAKFKFHGTLRKHIPGGEIGIDGARTVAEALARIAENLPELKTTLYEDDGRTLREYFVVVVNDEQVEFLDEGLDTRLTDADVVQVFPPVSGGLSELPPPLSPPPRFGEGGRGVG